MEIPCCSPKSRFLCLSLSLLGLLLVAILSFYLGRASIRPSPLSQVLPTPTIPTITPTPNETANWKNYTSPFLGFSVKYPSNWFLEEDILSSYKIEIQLKPFPDVPIAKCDFYKDNGSIYSSVTNVRLIKNNNPKITEVNVEYKDPGPGASGPHFVTEKDSSNRVMLSCYFFNEIFRETINQILSTFKFSP